MTKYTQPITVAVTLAQPAASANERARLAGAGRGSWINSQPPGWRTGSHDNPPKDTHKIPHYARLESFPPYLKPPRDAADAEELVMAVGCVGRAASRVAAGPYKRLANLRQAPEEEEAAAGPPGPLLEERLGSFPEGCRRPRLLKGGNGQRTGENQRSRLTIVTVE